ncbi:Uncharacterized protein PCOAH_00004390 [Plasmodium coatneyi]|uniref:UBP-type domain-containing protein n=1 Tax=Plasmodium coatneyi TaxID=208452 RepID=A0A1B1DTU8_9APIC|nr:Uncharacterized protein PCOAH_00004390 [Plasmodium coatneyi]ANQ06193.1 Uncharacterized protein PCOAH_00004390 [Plasmodium coatneyi]
MFHLIIYTKEHSSHVNNLLTLFENVYDRNGNKISKHGEHHGEHPGGENKGDMNDNAATLDKKVTEERAFPKQKIAQEGGGGPKVQHYTSSFLQLYINDERNFDLYLIDEEDDNHHDNDNDNDNEGGTTSVAADVSPLGVAPPTQKRVTCGTENEDTRRNQVSSKKGGEKRERGTSVKWPKEGINQKDTQPHDDDKSRRVNLPLHRSHMLFILSLPAQFRVDHFYRLINSYMDFIVQMKVFHVIGNISFLDEEEWPKGEEAKVATHPEESDEYSGCSEGNQHEEGITTCKNEPLATYERMHGVVKRRLKKKKKMKSYSVLIFFKTQIYADMFFSEYHCTCLNHVVEGRQGEWKNLVNATDEKGYPDWYVYCAFVSLVYYIVDEEVGTLQVDVDTDVLSQVDEPPERSEHKKGLKETHGGVNHLPSSNNNPFDINRFENFQKSIITDGNTCISTCPLCMELLCEDVCFTLTRSKKWHVRKKGKESKLHDYVNLSCNVCSLIFLYDSVGRLVGGSAVIGTPKGTPNGVAHSVENTIEEDKTRVEVPPVRDAPTRLGHIVGTLKCRNCNNVDDIWLCLTCANIGCGRYQKSHAKLHSTLYNHHYCLNLRTKKVWNYMREAFIEDKMEDDQSELANAWRGGSGPTNGGFCCNTFHSCVDAPPTGRADFLDDEYDHWCGDERESALDHAGHVDHIDHIYYDHYDTQDHYDSLIYNKIYDIFTDDAYISDGLKNELLYSLYSLLSHESNVYNSSLIELQCSYMSKVDQESRNIKNVRDAVNQVESQNSKMETFLQKVDSSIKAKNNERAQLQEKINFLRELNRNIISQRCGARQASKVATEGNTVQDDDDDDADSRKIKRLDETIQSLQAQVDELLRGL